MEMKLNKNLKPEQIHYNETTYYRANPYAKIGYNPVCSLKNRKHVDYQTEIPQGEEFFDPSHKKMFSEMKKKSYIADEHIFSNPEKFPFQNQIALDKNYYRSLNTIDIQGASVNSKMSMGVKNRLKAQEELKRRDSDSESSRAAQRNFMKLESQEESRRKLAEEHMKKNINRLPVLLREAEVRSYHSQKKLPPLIEKNKNIKIDFGVQVNDIIQKKLDLKKIEPFQNKSLINLQRNNPEIIIQNSKLYGESSMKKIDFDDKNINDFDPNTLEEQTDNNHFDESLNEAIRVNSEPINIEMEIQANNPMKSSQDEVSKLFDEQRRHLEQERRLQGIRQQYRKLNPTNLSYASLQPYKMYMNLLSLEKQSIKDK